MAQINQQSTPSGSISVPASGSYAIFSEPTDLGRLYLKDSDGNVYPAVSGSGGGGSGLIPIQEDGVAVGNAQTLNFTGTGIDSVAVAASVATVTVSGGGGGAGTSGSSGSSGSSGAAGANGTSGSSGADGAAGADGSSGSSGANGAAGTSGSSGANGDAGTSGSSGSSGADGAAGANGSSGSSGANGAAGADGSSGSSGADGTSGSSGANGAAGTSGSSGANGAVGADGSSGSSGANGAAGADGSSGSSGANGAAGTSGTSGADGVVSGNTAYGEISEVGGSSISIGTSFQGWNTGVQGRSLYLTFTSGTGTTGDSYTIPTGYGGDYLINAAYTFESSGNDTLTAAIFVNGVEQTTTTTSRAFANNTKGSFSITDLLALSVSDVVDIRFKTGGTTSFTPVNVSFNLSKLVGVGDAGTSGSSGANGADGSSGSSGANGAAGTSGSSGANGDAGTSGSSGSSGATGDAGTSGSSGANGAPGTSGSSGNDGAAGTSGISGTSGTSAAGGGATAYAVRINYDSNTEPDTSTQLTSSPWSSNSITVTINSVTDVVFDFPSESAPPIAVNAYFYNANTDKYVLSTLGLGNNSYANGQGFTSTIAANQASNNFFSSFSTDSEIKLNLTANNYGGSKKNLPPVFVHCYLVFTFA